MRDVVAPLAGAILSATGRPSRVPWGMGGYLSPMAPARGATTSHFN